MIISEKAKILKFIELRDFYITQLEKGKITKKEFNHKNYDIFKKLNLRPFSVLDSFDKAVYNYAYYNSKAKLALEEQELQKKANNLKKSKIFENNKLNYYSQKDKATLYMVNSEDGSQMEAYYIKIHSKNLSDIFEINFKNKNKIILHSKSDEIRDILIKKGCFDSEIRKSIIDSYVNNG